MMFHELLMVLRLHHWRRFGTWPTFPAHRWLWQPWVREFLRTYTPPVMRERSLCGSGVHVVGFAARTKTDHMRWTEKKP